MNKGWQLGCSIMREGGILMGSYKKPRYCIGWNYSSYSDTQCAGTPGESPENLKTLILLRGSYMGSIFEVRLR